MQLSHAQNRRAFHAALLEWYAQNGRLGLPWRNLHDDAQRAYKVYVSEIMLQQTQVQVVVPYFARFVARFESLRELANAQQEEVLRQWQGLGYYTRARNMHKAAQLCGASLPQSMDALLRLPGIGRYTAGAILCFGFAQPVSFVDANIRRVLARLFALPNPRASELEEKAQMLLNREDSFAHNQALLDIGAAVCLPKNPACSACPLLRFCKGASAWERYPEPKRKTTECKHIALAFVRRGDCVALVQSRERLYHGLYNLPEIPPQAAENRLCFGSFKHSYTRYRLDVSVCAHDGKGLAGDVVFVPIAKLDSIPLSSLCRKALGFVLPKA